MKISNDTLELVKILRDCVRAENGACKDIVHNLALLPAFKDATITAGFFVTKDGRIEDGHVWLVFSDGSCFDPAQDSFGEEGFGDIIHASKKDPKHSHYFPYTGEPGIPMEVLNFADKIQARLRTEKNRKSFSEMIEEDGPSTGPNPYRDPWRSLDEILEVSGAMGPSDVARQSSLDLPDELTLGGKGGIPQDEPDEEFKPEEFEDELRQLTMDDLSDGEDPDDLSLADLEDDDLREVDHPEYMPGGEESPRYDPEVELGKPSERNPTYNTGHPRP